MCPQGENDFQSVRPRDWKPINHSHLQTIIGNWRQCRDTDRSGESILEYDLHQFNEYTHGNGKYVCIAARGSGEARNATRYLYQFERNNADNSYDLYWAARCADHNYNNPRSIDFPSNQYRIAAPVPVVAPAPVPAPAPAPAPVVVPVVAPAPAQTPPANATPTWASIVRGGK